MTLLFGGNSGGNEGPKYTGLKVQTSAYDMPIPIMWGRTRVSFNVVWFNNFQPHTQSAGGKGLGGGKGGTTTTYTAAVILALGWGIISSCPNVYVNQSKPTTLGKLGLSLMTGTSTQSPWSFVTTKYPTEARSYPNIAYLYNSNMQLGSWASVPSMGIEAVGNLSGTMPGTPDVNMGDVVPDFLTNPKYGMGLVSSNIHAPTLAAYKSYLQAQGIFLSPYLATSEKATDIMDRWAQLTNTWIFWSGNTIKFAPLGDEAITANGATYTPNNSVRYDVGPEDFVTTENNPIPIKIQRVDPADAKNRTLLRIKDRALNYNSNPVEFKDQTLIDLFGLQDNPAVSADEITTSAVGQIVSSLLGKRAAYLRAKYSFTLPYRFVLLEPGDIITITHPFIKAINKLPVRVMTVEENDKGDLDFTAEEYTGQLGIVRTGDMEANSNTGSVDFMADPGNINDPCIFEPSSNSSNIFLSIFTSLGLVSGAKICATATGASTDWGGCHVHISFDGGTTYRQIGTILAGAKQGLLTAPLPSHADPDTVDTLSVNFAESHSALDVSITHADADASRTLSYVNPPSVAGVIQRGEFLAYGTVTTTGTFTSDQTYLRRGLSGTPPAAHSTGDNFTLVDLANVNQDLVSYGLPSAYIGQTLFLKFTSFNRFGLAEQDISTVTAYQYSPNGAGFGGGTNTGGQTGVPTVPTGLTASGGTAQVILNWSANPLSDNVTTYLVYRASGHGASFGSASLIASPGTSTTFTDTGVTANSQWTYFLKAQNAVGASNPTAGVDGTAGVGNTLALRPTGSLETSYSAGQVLMNIPMKTGDALPDDLAGSLLDCSVGPGADVTVTLQKNGVTIFTGSILSGATTGTWNTGSAVTFTDGDRLKLLAPSPADSSLSGLGWLLMGTRTQ